VRTEIDDAHESAWEIALVPGAWHCLSELLKHRCRTYLIRVILLVVYVDLDRLKHSGFGFALCQDLLLDSSSL
jgi:hypothetical protein